MVLALCVAASFGAGAVGSWATFAGVRTWYPLLHKPGWNPPNWIFGPVWTCLYVLMGIAVWRGWRARQARGLAAGWLLAGHGVQLILNALWSVLFFGLRQPAWAAVEIAGLWLCLAWLQVALWREDRWAGVLWLPYVLWVSFAAALTVAIVRLN